MNKKQALFFKIASYGCIAFALIHLIGHFEDPSALFSDEAGKALLHGMQTYELNLMGQKRTIEDFLTGHSWYLSVFMLAIGIQNLLAIKHHADRPQFIRTVTILNLGMFAILLGLTYRYFIYPPLALFAIIWLLYCISLVIGRTSSGN